MNQIAPIFKKEFFGYFRSPVGYVILAVFHIVLIGLAVFAGYYESNQASLDTIWTFLPWTFLIFIPATGMRLWSEEKRSGSIELLFTLPVPTASAVLGKFLAAWAFIGIALALTFSLALTTSYLGNPDWGIIFSGYFGSILMAAAYLSISSVCSALTKNQVIAFVISVLICVLVTLFGSQILLTVFENIASPGMLDFLGNFSFLNHFQTMTRGLIELSAISFFVVLTIAFLGINIIVLENQNRGNTDMKTSTKIHAAFLILINFLLLHYVVSSIPLRFDMTAGNSFTLSDSAKSLLAKVEEPVRFDFYRTRSVEGLSPQIKMHIQNFGDRVEQMLRQFERAAKGKIILDRIDPEPDTPAEENAIAAGVHGQSLPNGDTIFLGLVISQGDSEHVIPFFDWNKEGSIEYDIAKAVHEAQQLSKPKLGLISSLPLKAPPMPMMPGQPPQEDQYIISELESSFNIEVIEPTASELPKDLDMLVVIHPIGLPDTLLFGIDQFTLSGKPMFLAVDPSSLFFRSQQQQNQMAMMGRPNPNTSSDFPRFFSTWGIKYSASEALADPDIAYTQQNSMQPAWLIFRENNVSEDFLPAAELNAVLLLESGSLSLDESSKLTFEPILQTTESAGSINGMMLQFAQQGALLNQMEASGEKQTVAGLLSGEFTTAFPNGKPSNPSAAPDGDGESEDTPDEPKQLYTGKGNVFIIADTDWLLDQFSIRRQNFLGMMTIQPINDNLAMGTNIIEFLGGSQDLIGIRSKGEIARAFDRVQAMEVEAQKQYQVKLQGVEEKISELSQEIQTLLSQNQGSGRLVAGPELSAKITNLQSEQASLRTERRNVRRELRKDIDALKWKLVSLNIGYSPIGLVIFGFIFYRMRKQKAL